MRNTDPDKVFDGLLVLQYLDGDRKALELLIKRWSKRILAYAYRSTGSRESAQDIAQEVWIVAIKSMAKLQEPSKVGSWLLSIAHNKCQDWRRSTSKSKEFNDERQHIVEPAADGTDGPLRSLRAGIQQLSHDHQTVLNLFYQEGMSLLEISEILKLSKGTVKSRLFYARETLKNKLKK